jgi:thiol-disulfide isomerase/thioredoxin
VGKVLTPEARRSRLSPMTLPDRPQWWRGKLTALALSCALGCAGADPAGDTVSETVGDPSRQEYGRSIDGRAVHGQTGQHVLVSFWATWCGPCRQEVPLLEALARRFKSDKLLVVAVNYGEKRDVVRSFIRRNEALTMTVTSDPEKRISGRFQVKGIPTVALIDPQDRVLWQKSGYSPESFEKIIREVSQIVEGRPAAD